MPWRQKVGVLGRYSEPFLKRGLLPPSNFEVSDVVGPGNTYCELEYIGTRTRNSFFWTGDLSTLSEPPLWTKMQLSTLVLDSRYTDYTHQGALANVSAAQVDIGVTLGELLETARFLISPVKSLVALSKKLGVADLILNKISVNGSRYFKPTNLHAMGRRARGLIKTSCKKVGGVQVLDESSNLWNAYRFGVRPLLGEISGYLDLMKEGLKPPGGPLFHGRSKFEKMVETTVLRNSAGYSLVREAASTFTEQDTFRTDVQFLRNKFDVFTDLQVLGLHPSQLVNVAWELVPLSFVFDRFVGLGKWIEAKRPKPGVTILGATHSLKRKRSLEMAVQRLYMGAQWPTYYISTSWYAEPLKWQSTLYRRIIANAVPVFPVINPTLLDISQHVDHLALLWQRLPRIKK